MRSRLARRLAILLAVPWLAWAAVRLTGVDTGFPLVPVMAFTPYVAVAAVIPLGVGLLVRSRSATLTALVAALALLVAVIPRGLSTGTAAAADNADHGLTVASVNMLFGGADADVIAGVVLDRDVDLLAVQELTPDALDRLLATALPDTLPYRLVSTDVGTEAQSAAGGGLFSRFPLRSLGLVPGGFHEPRAEVSLPGGETVTMTSVHIFPPATSRTSVGQWTADLAALPRPHEREILAGDFNATFDHSAFRRLLGTGYTDAAGAVGAGWTPTWNVGRIVPPALTIDHVLVGPGIGVRRFEVVPVPLTDHRLVCAELRW